MFENTTFVAYLNYEIFDGQLNITIYGPGPDWDILYESSDIVADENLPFEVATILSNTFLTYDDYEIDYNDFGGSISLSNNGDFVGNIYYDDWDGDGNYNINVTDNNWVGIYNNMYQHLLLYL